MGLEGGGSGWRGGGKWGESGAKWRLGTPLSTPSVLEESRNVYFSITNSAEIILLARYVKIWSQ